MRSLSPTVIRAAPRILQIALLLEEEGNLAEAGGLAYLVECVDASEAMRLPGESSEEMATRLAKGLATRRRAEGDTPEHPAE